MKRNLDLIRHILLTLEESSSENFHPKDFANQNYTTKQAAYHLALLDDAGLILTTHVPISGSERHILTVHRLTNNGHDFLDAIRDENIFNETKKKLLSVAGTSGLDLVMSIAMKFLTEKLGL